MLSFICSSFSLMLLNIQRLHTGHAFIIYFNSFLYIKLEIPPEILQYFSVSDSLGLGKTLAQSTQSIHIISIYVYHRG